MLGPTDRRQALAQARAFALGVALLLCAGPSRANEVARLERFEREVRPLLVERCAGCHGEKRQRGELRLDTTAGIARGGESGALFDRERLQASLLLRAVSYRDDDLRMPPKGRLSDGEIAILERWVRDGAVLPEIVGEAPDAAAAGIDLESARSSHWAYRPLDAGEAPAPTRADLVESPIDAHLLARLEEAGLGYAPEADRRTLARRAWLDLVGLPPPPAAVESFVDDEEPEALEKIVDALLASPAYGERQARHWLDVARYADSNGSDENTNHAEAWRYRDWVVRSMSFDKPYDRFVTEQLAGDLLPEPEDRDEALDRLIATGFLLLGPKVLAEPDKLKMQMDIIDEDIDVIGKALLGLTLSCARCHDHKFDPVSTRDYHALAGTLRSTRLMHDYATVAKWMERPLATSADLVEMERLRGEIGRLEGAAKELEKRAASDTQAKAELESTRAERDRLRARLDGWPKAMVVADRETVVEQPILVRGDHGSPRGDPVPRGVPAVFEGLVPAPSMPFDRSGRLELARWLTRSEHPLTARVIVNRVWQARFGVGIVSTPDDFGARGDRPSHPRLLDHLAIELQRGGWSLKRLHRSLLLTRAWRSGSEPDARAAELDPEGRLLWRFRPRRLEVEPIRDSILAVSGRLDRTLGGTHHDQPSYEYIRGGNHEDSPRRAIYLPVVRNRLNEMFTAFDLDSPEVVVGRRPSTVVPQQALFLLNNGFVRGEAERLAERVLAAEPEDRGRRLDLAWRLALARPPRAEERERVEAFLTKIESTTSEREAWATLCQTLFASTEFLSLR